MTINPIIPIWLMLIVCVGLLFLRRKNKYARIRQVIAVVLIFLINLRIMVPGGETYVNTEELDTYVLFVVDNTISMVARDYDGDTERLTAVKDDCKAIIEELEGAKFAVMDFNNEANLLSPYSDNADYAENVINSIYPLSELYARGSSMNVCIDKMTSTLKRAAEKGDGKVVVFFISDGEITNNDTLESFDGMKKYIDGGAVLGYGTKEGGNMYVQSYYSSEPDVLMDYSSYPYEPAVSKIDETNLKKIADDLSVEYINMNDGNADSIAKSIRSMSGTSDRTTRQVGYTDIYYVFAGLLAAVIIWEFMDIRRRVYSV